MHQTLKFSHSVHLGLTDPNAIFFTLYLELEENYTPFVEKDNAPHSATAPSCEVPSTRRTGKLPLAKTLLYVLISVICCFT